MKCSHLITIVTNNWHNIIKIAIKLAQTIPQINSTCVFIEIASLVFQLANLRHIVNGKIPQLKQQISELGFSVVLHMDDYGPCAPQLERQFWYLLFWLWDFAVNVCTLTLNITLNFVQSYVVSAKKLNCICVSKAELTYNVMIFAHCYTATQAT